MTTMIQVENVAKTFTLHNQGGARLPVFDNVNFHVEAGEALVLAGASGAGKSSLLRILYGNYKPTAGTIHVTHAGRPVDIVAAVPRTVLDIRRRTLGFVSQFLRVIPRVSTLDIVRDPLLARGAAPQVATEKAKAMLARLNLPERLWNLAPATFSGGEQQRVNIARGFISDLPILLLDEPTASLDAANRAVVVDLVAEKKRAGVAMVAIVHDDEVRHLIADRLIDVTSFAAAA